MRTLLLRLLSVAVVVLSLATSPNAKPSPAVAAVQGIAFPPILFGNRSATHCRRDRGSLQLGSLRKLEHGVGTCHTHFLKARQLSGVGQRGAGDVRRPPLLLTPRRQQIVDKVFFIDPGALRTRLLCDGSDTVSLSTFEL